mgnify:CR=1 FL=1
MREGRPLECCKERLRELVKRMIVESGEDEGEDESDRPPSVSGQLTSNVIDRRIGVA